MKIIFRVFVDCIRCFDVVFFIVLCYVVVFFFFFSSRRRHTRLQGDWSSDVCSSDLQRLRRRQQQPLRSELRRLLRRRVQRCFGGRLPQHKRRLPLHRRRQRPGTHVDRKSVV